MEALESSNGILLEEIMHAHAEIKGLRKHVSVQLHHLMKKSEKVADEDLKEIRLNLSRVYALASETTQRMDSADSRIDSLIRVCLIEWSI